MKLPKPDRFAYFPAALIFGRNLVPVYLADHGPAIPLTDIADSIGITMQTAFRLVEKNREAIILIDAESREQIFPESDLVPLKKRICLAMDGICLLLLSIDHHRLKDAVTRERIIIAKFWLSTQLSNRIKIPGEKSQHRWDASLNKKQAKQVKELIAQLPDSM